MIEEANEEAGIQIPLAELGGSLAAEYKVAVMEDQSLEKWRVNADQSVNGFKWDQGLLKKFYRGCNQGEQRSFGCTRLFQTQDATASVGSARAC